MPRQGFFIFPAGNRLLQGLAGIRLEKIPDIGIILKLPVNNRLSLFLFFQNLIISFYRLGIGLSGIGFQPFLKGYRKRKAVSDFFFEKSTVFFRTNKIRLNNCLFRNYSHLFPGFGYFFYRVYSSRIKVTGDSFRNLFLAARGGQAVLPAEGNQLFFQVIVAAEGCCIQFC